MQQADLVSELEQFIGTVHYYSVPFNRGIVYTDGVKHLAQSANCYWLIDAIASWQLRPRVRAEPFQVWELTVNSDKSSRLLCTDGNDNKVTVQLIPYTDFPLDHIMLYLEFGSMDGVNPCKVLMLPSER